MQCFMLVQQSMIHQINASLIIGNGNGIFMVYLSREYMRTLSKLVSVIGVIGCSHSGGSRIITDMGVGRKLTRWEPHNHNRLHCMEQAINGISCVLKRSIWTYSTHIRTYYRVGTSIQIPTTLYATCQQGTTTIYG